MSECTNWMIIIGIVLIAMVIFYPKFFVIENMAPLDYGTYENKYPRGKCDVPTMKRSSCMVGNCPLGTTVDDKMFCHIECAQISDPNERQACEKKCMELLKDCNEPVNQQIA
jgi:hypothetical protein